MRDRVATLLLTLWFGAALLAVAVVAPAAFRVLPTRSLAGDLVGAVLPVVFHSAALVGLVVAWLYRGSGRVIALLAVCMPITAWLSVFVIDRRLSLLRASLGMPVDALLPQDPRRALFGAWHVASVLALGVAMAAAATALIVIARRPPAPR
ncbi:MAG: DUF4149 domain-containing protein [Gemmatimonadaceae bacterium]|nr:DUF4149 domain-containing protein [Gemmatimonadaceae bacterium]